MSCAYFGKYFLWNRQHTAGRIKFFYEDRAQGFLEVLMKFYQISGIKYFTGKLIIVLLLALVLVIRVSSGSAAACGNCGFESRKWHGCLSLMSVVCFQVEVSASG